VLRQLGVGMLRFQLLSIQIVVFFSTFLVVLIGCQSVQNHDPSVTKTYEGFILNGNTTKQQIQEKF
jgi:cyanate lyase